MREDDDFARLKLLESITTSKTSRTFRDFSSLRVLMHFSYDQSIPGGQQAGVIPVPAAK